MFSVLLSLILSGEQVEVEFRNFLFFSLFLVLCFKGELSLPVVCLLLHVSGGSSPVIVNENGNRSDEFGNISMLLCCMSSVDNN